MGKEQLPELVDRDAETLPSIELNQSKLDALIQFSQQTEKIGKALDRIRTFVMGRAMPGDWVQHGDKINLSGPAAERILSALGLMGVPVKFSEWGYNKDTGSDKNGDWFNWTYWANVEIGGLNLGRIEGRAGSRDIFFGYERGAWKDLADVKEADARMAARRGVFKEAIKVALGLRGIPADQAKALGLDPSKIKMVSYSSGGNTEASAAPAKIGTAVGIKNVTQRTINKKDKTTTIVYVIEDENGAQYETFSETIAKAAKKVKESGGKAMLDWEPASNPKFAPKLKSLTEATVEPEPEAEPA